jgi:HEAT repeat protein
MLLLAAVLTATVRAEEAAPDGVPEGAAAEAAAKAKAEEERVERFVKARIPKFRSTYKSSKVRTRCNALLDLSLDPHPLVIEELAKVVKKEREAEVRDALFMILGEMKPYVKEAGDVIKTHVRGAQKQPEVLKSMARSIGRLGYTGAHDELVWLLDHADHGVVTEAIRAIGDVKDMKAVPNLHELARREGKGDSWETGEVKVDTGAAGDADQKAAEAQWNAKYGNQQRRGAGETVVKTWMRELREALEKITGKKFETLPELEAWMEEHREEIGLPKR